MATFNENNAVRQVATPGAWTAAAQKGAWIDMRGFQRITFVPSNGELDADMTFKIFAASDDEGAGATEVSTALRNTFTNGTDEGRIGLIEVLSRDLPVDLPFVTIEVTPGATDGFGCIAILSEPDEAPVSNATTDGVAFADSLA